jgi:hypothetical protein
LEQNSKWLMNCAKDGLAVVGELAKHRNNRLGTLRIETRGGLIENCKVLKLTQDISEICGA